MFLYSGVTKHFIDEHSLIHTTMLSDIHFNSLDFLICMCNIFQLCLLISLLCTFTGKDQSCDFKYFNKFNVWTALHTSHLNEV